MNLKSLLTWHPHFRSTFKSSTCCMLFATLAKTMPVRILQCHINIGIWQRFTSNRIISTACSSWATIPVKNQVVPARAETCCGCVMVAPVLGHAELLWAPLHCIDSLSPFWSFIKIQKWGYKCNLKVENVLNRTAGALNKKRITGKWGKKGSNLLSLWTWFRDNINTETERHLSSASH